MAHSQCNPIGCGFIYFESECSNIIDLADRWLHESGLVCLTLFGDSFVGISNPDVLRF